MQGKTTLNAKLITVESYCMLFHVNDILCGLFNFFVDAETKKKAIDDACTDERTDKQTKRLIETALI